MSLTAPGLRPGAFRNDGVAPQRIVVSARDYVAHFQQLRERFAAVRGVEPGRNKGVVPATNVGDVLKIANAWSQALEAAGLRRADRSEVERWTTALARIVELAQGRESSEIYPENPRFWQQDAQRLAIFLNSIKARPSRWSIALDSAGEAVAELPGRLEAAGKAAGQIAAAPFKGAAEGLGLDSTTLLALGAGLAGILLVPRLLK